MEKEKMNDPAVLFYSADFLVGVIDMTMEERGQYITLLSYQHQKGHLSMETIRFLVGSVSEKVLAHFKIDDQGLYFNKRMDKEINARKGFVLSRRENGKKGGRPKKLDKPIGNPTGKATKNLMGNEDVDVNENINIDDNLFNYIQKELNRTLSSSEIELVNTWEDNDITRHAIKETALARATSLKYTERILETYKSKGLKTLAEVERYEKDFREKKSNKKPTWFDKDIKEESASNEEQEELNELLREFK